MKYNNELLNKMSELTENDWSVQCLRKGGIHIKEKNRGKFTAAAKRAGKSVQEYARDVVNDPNATTLQKRRAQFALNAKKFKHQYGGIILPPFYIIDKVNNSNTNFANRLLNPNRTHIQNWENNNQMATHKLSVGSDDYGYFIYPEVQEINGQLIDFTRPPYHTFAGQDSAIENNDFVRVNSLDDGLWFTQNYKQFYPSFKR